MTSCEFIALGLKHFRNTWLLWLAFLWPPAPLQEIWELDPDLSFIPHITQILGMNFNTYIKCQNWMGVISDFWKRKECMMHTYLTCSRHLQKLVLVLSEWYGLSVLCSRYLKVCPCSMKACGVETCPWLNLHTWLAISFTLSTYRAGSRKTLKMRLNIPSS